MAIRKNYEILIQLNILDSYETQSIQTQVQKMYLIPISPAIFMSRKSCLYFVDICDMIGKLS